MLRPPNDGQDAMHVIRHDNKRLELDLGKMKGNFEPGLLNDASEGGQVHDTVYDLGEEATLPARAKGDEVQSALRIIETLEADGTAVKRVTTGF